MHVTGSAIEPRIEPAGHFLGVSPGVSRDPIDGILASLPRQRPAVGERSAMNRATRWAIAVIFAVQILLLPIAGWNHRFQVNPDGVAYLRIASYWSGGQTDLMISGYWGPLLSWLMVPWLGLVSDPLFAARIVQGISAVVFLGASVAVFRRYELRPAELVAGTSVAALAGIHWSVALITPDLLLAGLLGAATICTFPRSGPANTARAILGGVLFGLAYLTKPIALPIFVLLIVAELVIRIRRQRADTRHTTSACRTRFRDWLSVPAPGDALQGIPIAVLAFLCVAGPWIAALSLKYDRPTFSTSARIAHAVVGPADPQRGHPLTWRFANPEPGRLTAWEDPTGLPYRYWFPLGSLREARHQLWLVVKNTGKVFSRLSSFDFFYLGAGVLITGIVFPGPWGARLPRVAWRWGAIVVLCCCLPYLPVYAQDSRYYYPAFPFLLAGSLSMGTGLIRCSGNRRWLRGLGGAILASLVLQSAGDAVLSVAPVGEGSGRPAWLVVSERLPPQAIAGTIASNTTEGLYLAMRLERPILGWFHKAAAKDFRESEADLLVVDRASKVVEDLDRDPEFRNLDAQLFSSPAEAESCPLTLYLRTRAEPADAG